MSTALALTALLMGVAASPHCAAMCGAPCAAVAGAAASARAPSARPVIALVPAVPQANCAQGAPAGAVWRASLTLQAGRVAGYAVAGAAAAVAMGALAWMGQQSAALRPVWMFMHLGVLAWGLALLMTGREPAWAVRMGRSLWARVQPLAARPGGVFALGASWAALPCGLLYSALLVAGLAGGPLDGAAAMALFALGSAGPLLAAPWLVARMKALGTARLNGWGTRLAGAVLVGVAAWALWADTLHRVAVWCGVVS